MKISLDVNPLSSNRAWQGRRFKSADYKVFEKEVTALLPVGKSFKGYVRIDYSFYVKNFNRDVDNMIKTLQDLLVKRGYIKNDNSIVELHAVKIKSPVNKVEIDIRECDP